MSVCMIVDDSSTIRKIVRNMLEGFGIECLEAENGQAGLEEFQRSAPDLIMLDWNMPVMNGIDFIRALNRDAKDTVPPVIFCTTEKDMSFIEQAMNAGAADYIMKPFERDMLKDKLANLGFIDDLDS